LPALEEFDTQVARHWHRERVAGRFGLSMTEFDRLLALIPGPRLRLRPFADLLAERLSQTALF
jgi:hypothetical protein